MINVTKLSKKFCTSKSKLFLIAQLITVNYSLIAQLFLGKT